MEQIKKGLVVCFLLLSAFSFAQDDSFIKPNLVRVQLTYAPSVLFANSQSYFYLHGTAEFCLNKQISMAGEGYYSLGKSNASINDFDFNHSGFFGVNYHFTKNNNDVYLGIQPGLSFVKLDAPNASTGVNPVFSSVLGYNFYVSKVFHFFIQNRIVLGEHINDAPIKLNEFRFSAGLGFNL